MFSVSQLAGRLKSQIEGAFPEVQVFGELGKAFAARSGHFYLTLKDERAALDAVIYRSTARLLPTRPAEGTMVVVQGYLTFYEPRGQLQLIVQWLEPAGRGELQAAFDRLKAQLDAEGLFDPARRRPLPFLPRAVGVVTSGQGAARRDIEAVVHRRSPQIPIVLSPTRVEGAGAAPHIVRALEQLARRPEVDVIIVGRGGGSLESLWAFNTEAVARAIAACPVPVISAVGHETDVTIADLVADHRAATPSEAAEQAVPERATLLHTIDTHERRLRHAVEARIARDAARLDQAHRRLEAAVRAPLERRRRRLEAARRRLVAVEPGRRLVLSRARLQRAEARLLHAGEARVRRAREAFTVAVTRLEALSPLAVLSRGYSITQHGAAVVRRFDAVPVGAEVDIRLHVGRLRATVTDRRPEEDDDG